MMNRRRAIALACFWALVFGLFPLQSAFSAPWSKSKTKAVKKLLLERLRNPPKPPAPQFKLQPAVCLVDANSTSSVVNVGGVNKIRASVVQVPGTPFCQPSNDQVGAQILVPPGTACGTVSFDVTGLPSNVVSFMMVGKDSTGQQFFGPNVAASTDTTLYFNLLSLVFNGVGVNATSGSTLVSLYISFSGGGVSDFPDCVENIDISNVKVNEIPVETLLTTPVTCPPDFLIQK